MQKTTDGWDFIVGITATNRISLMMRISDTMERGLDHGLQTFAPVTVTYCAVDQTCLVLATKSSGKTVDRAIGVEKPQPSGFVQMYSLLKEKRERNTRGSLHPMGFSNFTVPKKHLGNLL